jgi:hypothetical protein
MLDKSIYTGQSTSSPKKGAIPHGIGTLIKPDQSKYDGGFSWGRFSGKGRITYANGDYMECEWEKGEPKGKITISENGVIKEKMI